MKKMKIGHLTLSPLSRGLLATAMVFAFTVIGAPAHHGPPPGPIGPQGELQVLYQALRTSINGNVYRAQQSIQQALQNARYSNSLEQATLVKLLRQSKRAINVPVLNPTEKKVVLVDNLSQAIAIVIRQKNSPGITKKELQSGIQHLRVAKLVSQAGFCGKTMSSLVKGKFFLQKHKYAPAIRRAINKVNQATATLSSGNAVTKYELLQAQQLATQAIQIVRNSRIFQNGGHGGGGFF